MNSEDRLLASGKILMQRPHPAGGVGLLVVGLPNGALMMRMHQQRAKIIPPAAVDELERVIAEWRGRAAGAAEADPTILPDPEHGPVLDE
jgi:hypothetical protein